MHSPPKNMINNFVCDNKRNLNTILVHFKTKNTVHEVSEMASFKEAVILAYSHSRRHTAASYSLLSTEFTLFWLIINSRESFLSTSQCTDPHMPASGHCNHPTHHLMTNQKKKCCFYLIQDYYDQATVRDIKGSYACPVTNISEIIIAPHY